MHTLTIETERHTQLLDITARVRDAVQGASGAAALVYVPHTTAGLTINEHADPMVARDFEMALERIAPDGWGWQHIEEGEENAPSHIRAALMGPQVVIPLRDGQLQLGTWQGISPRWRNPTAARTGGGRSPARGFGPPGATVLGCSAAGRL